MNSNGTKLSKRQGDIDVQHFKQTGIFPEVLLSFVTEFGGGFIRERGEPTVYTMQDLITQVVYEQHSDKFISSFNCTTIFSWFCIFHSLSFLPCIQAHVKWT